MTNAEAVNWLINITADIGKPEHHELWHYEQALTEIREMLETEPQRMRGKWIPHHDEVILFDRMPMIGGMTCSICGWKTYNKMHLLFGCPYKYCPKCGAEMRGGE